MIALLWRFGKFILSEGCFMSKTLVISDGPLIGGPS